MLINAELIMIQLTKSRLHFEDPFMAGLNITGQDTTNENTRRRNQRFTFRFFKILSF